MAMATKPVSPLQAIVIADSFDEYFRPITLEKPRALLPIAGIPLLNYTIEFLASGGVREIFVLCKAHADAIEAHINSLKGKMGVDVKCMKFPRSKDMGDVLRGMAKADLISQDFVLVCGDIVSNQKLLPTLQEHMLRREKDKDMLMTLLLTKTAEDPEMAKLKIPLLNTLFTSSGVASAVPSTTVTPHVSAILPIDGTGDGNDEYAASTPFAASTPLPASRSARTASVSAGVPLMSSSPSTSSFMPQEAPSLASSAVASTSAPHASRFGESSVYHTLASNEAKLVILDSDNGQLFLYEERSSSHGSPHVDLDTALLRNNRRISVRNDLQDSGVAICSPDVLMKFDDHFDYKNLSQLVRGVINDELQELKVFTAIADENYYTRRVSSLRRYHQVTGDVLRRWAFPQVPDSNILPGTSWSYTRPGIYKEHHVHLHRDCIIQSDSAIGERSSLAAGAVVSQSTIGRNCQIGRNVKISNSFIWDNVTIGDDTTLDHVIVCDHAIIGASCTIPAGCIIGYHVVLGTHTSLSPLTKITAFGSSGNLSAPKPKTEDDFGEDYGSSEDDTSSYGSEDSDDDEMPSSSSGLPKESRKKKNTLEENFGDIELGAGGVGRRWKLPPIPFNELSTGWETVQHIRDVLATIQRMRKGGASSGGAGGKEGEDEEPATDLEAFSREVSSIVTSYCKDPKKEIQRLVLEVNALKFAHDRSFLDCISAVFMTLLRQADPAALMKTLVALMKRFAPCFPAFLFSEEDEKEFIFALEEFCDEDENKVYAAQFTNILNKLYELEIIKEQAFLDWAAEHEGEDEDDTSALYKAAKTFIDWLKEEEDEEEEEDDDE